MILQRSLSVLFLLGISISGAYAQDAVSTAELRLDFEGDRAYQHVADHVNVGPRPTATLGSIQAGNLILSKLDELGWQTEEDWHVVNLGDTATFDEIVLQTLEDWQPVTLNTLLEEQFNGMGAGSNDWRNVEVNDLFIPIRNLVATYAPEPSPDGVQPPILILGAHYDSRIYSDKDPIQENRNLPMPGANDGGSGVGVLLELARVISENYAPNVEIRLVFFDAEDNGRIPPWTNILPNSGGYIVGSSYYATTLDSSEIVREMILVDLVGEFDQRFPMEGYSVQYHPELVNAVWEVAADLGYGAQFPMENRGAITDDHVPFIARGIPAVDIIDLDYAYWDTSQDTLDKIDPVALERVGRVLQAYLESSGAISHIDE